MIPPAAAMESKKPTPKRYTGLMISTASAASETELSASYFNPAALENMSTVHMTSARTEEGEKRQTPT